MDTGIERLLSPFYSRRVLHLKKAISEIICALSAGRCSVNNARKMSGHLKQGKSRDDDITVSLFDDFPIYEGNSNINWKYLSNFCLTVYIEMIFNFRFNPLLEFLEIK